MQPTFQQQLAFYAPRVQRAALGLLCDEQDAAEATQEALLKAWRARERYDPRRPFYPWLYTIVRNTCKDALARSHQKMEQELDTEALPSQQSSPLESLDSREARERVRRAIARLDQAQREVISMRHFQDLSYSEMASLLEVPVGTVMSRLYRARRALLGILGELP